MYLNNGQSQGDSEALACRGAVKLAAKIRLMEITVEGDSEVVRVSDELRVWLEDIPSEIAPIVINDIS
ncbi:hypothetical protein CFP56_017374 [Quercus suber]|uniref:RNase H type-1 domain-containing protein n=1 Tax=Quercus suber TaxID=58331 RepID=A0AAW0KLT0_QUESU|nr:hypothetical protein CFP56_53070 [Quercus suber]